MGDGDGREDRCGGNFDDSKLKITLAHDITFEDSRRPHSKPLSISGKAMPFFMGYMTRSSSEPAFPPPFTLTTPTNAVARNAQQLSIQISINRKKAVTNLMSLQTHCPACYLLKGATSACSLRHLPIWILPSVAVCCSSFQHQGSSEDACDEQETRCLHHFRQ